MLRLLMALTIAGLISAVSEPGQAQDAPAPDRAATGGAQTLEDILARQRGEKVDDTFRRAETGNPDSAAAIAAQLGTLGGASDSDLFRALRYGADFLAGVIVLLGLFFLIRGRIAIEGEKTGRKILRFRPIERFGHWLFAGSFILLALTGLITLFGRGGLIPIFGHDAYAVIAAASKWIHNNAAWAFMLGLVLIIVNWVFHNIPNRHDLVWLAKGGGLFSAGSHPPARKFNAGQKIIFWACVILGLSISASGLSLLFPFELPMFAKTFVILNDIGAPGWIGMAPLPETLAPHEEMQYAQLWHAIIAFVFIAIILAHIYLGTLGMEGAIDAMTTGEVEEQWAREHHGLWVDEVKARETESSVASPAE